MRRSPPSAQRLPRRHSHGCGWSFLFPRYLFGRGIISRLYRLGRREIHGCDALRFCAYIDRSHQLREKKFHGGLGALVFRERAEKGSRQHITIFVIAAQRCFFFARRYLLQFQLHGTHQAFRKVRRVIVLQFRRETRRKGRFLKERPLDSNYVEYMSGSRSSRKCKKAWRKTSVGISSPPLSTSA